jgi:hypothetical protein
MVKIGQKPIDGVVQSAEIAPQSTLNKILENKKQIPQEGLVKRDTLIAQSAERTLIGKRS